jgi:diacylglycerol kinase family enzyme
MSALTPDTERRLDARLRVQERPPSKRMLIIVNPYATTVSDRLKNLVVYALRGRYLVDAVDTQRRDHATELCREAAQRGYDVVVAFGGDGTVNEAANGLVGSRTPLSALPGGRANVYCRILGIPTDVVDATEHLLALADDWRPRSVDLGRVHDRFFLFSAGVGLDASVVQRVDEHPGLKARAGEYYYAWRATATFTRDYLIRPRKLEARFDDMSVTGVTVIVQNAEPYTYFGDRPVQVAPTAGLESGELAGAVLTRASPLDVPSFAWRALRPRARVADSRHIHAFSSASDFSVRSLDGRPLPVQVDGDYLGDLELAEFSIVTDALLVVA